MSLFGNLHSLPLEELLQLLAHKEGALEIWNAKDIPATTIYSFVCYLIYTPWV